MKLVKAQAIAANLVKILKPYCERIDIAGSIRRCKPEVRDIEIVCEAKITEYKNLFGEVTGFTRNKRFVELVDSFGKTNKGSAAYGRYKQIELPEGINLDLFMPGPVDYYRQLAIRTGSAEYVATEIAREWRKKGWCGSDMGFRKIEDCFEQISADGKITWKCVNKNGELPPIWHSEEDFFKWLGIPWLDPVLRTV